MEELQTAPASMMEHLSKIKSGEINNEAPLQSGDEGMIDVPIPGVENKPAEVVEEKPATEVVAEEKPTEVVEKPVTEKVAEVEKPATETAPTKEKQNDFFEMEETAPVSEDGKPTPTDIEKARAWDAITKDPEFDLFIKAKQAGKSLADLSKEYQPVDYSKMDAEAVMKHYGQLKNYTDDKIEQSLEWIAGLPPIQQDRELSALVNELDANQQAKFKNLGLNFEKDIQSQQMIDKKFQTDMAQMKEVIAEREFYGVKLSKQDADAFDNWVSTEFPKYVNSDGTYNVKMLANFWLGAVKMPAIQKANVSKGASEARMEVLKEVSRPSENSAVATKLPEPKPQMTDVERASKGVAKHFGGRG